MENVRLYSFFRSAASWRVRIALAWKGIPYKYIPVNLFRDGGEQWKPEYLHKSPLGKVPALEFTEDGVERCLTESAAIIGYLEERFPERPFLPQSPYLRARCWMLAEIVNSAIQPMQNLSTLKYVKHTLKCDDMAWAAHWITTGLVGLEAAVQETAGTFCIGDTPTAADIFLVPQIGGARRFKADISRIPTLLRIEAACAKLPAFAGALPDKQPDFEVQ